jgi:hypothetical protein
MNLLTCRPTILYDLRISISQVHKNVFETL